MSDSFVFLESGGPEVFGADYSTKVLTTARANLIAYWPLSEASGTVADNAEGTAARDGTYARNVSTMGTQTGIGDGKTAPTFDGTNDIVDIYSASLAAAWNGAEGTAKIWFQMATGGWDPAVWRKMLHVQVDASNYVDLSQYGDAAGWVQHSYNAAGTTEQHSAGGWSSLAWHQLVVTWSVVGDEVIWYLDGAPLETDTVLGTWAGDPASTTTLIGGSSTVPAEMWKGSLAHCALWSTPLSGAQVATLAVV